MPPVSPQPDPRSLLMSRLSRTCTRLLAPTPSLAVALSVEDPELVNGLRSLLGSAGASVVEDGPAEAGVLEARTTPNALIDTDDRALIERVAPGGPVVVVVRAVPRGEHPNEVAARLGACLDLREVQAELDDGVVVLRGLRRAPVGNAKAKELRGIGHAMEPSILIGRGGLSAELVASAREALERHGLIKAKLTPQCELDKSEAARDLAWATGAHVVQRVGKTVLLYRPDVKLEPPVAKRRRS